MITDIYALSIVDIVDNGIIRADEISKHVHGERKSDVSVFVGLRR